MSRNLWITLAGLCAAPALAGEMADCLLAGAEALLGRPYAAGTLVGSATEPEELVCRSDSLDCMTFLATLVSRCLPGDSCGNLRHWRYREGAVDWSARRHFFSDWGLDHACLRDAAAEWPFATAHSVVLNERDAGRQWLPGLPNRPAELHIAPPTAATLAELQSGDLIGFVSPLPGLDVSHTALVRRRDGKATILHASSRQGRVVEEPLQDHPAWKHGLLVFRWEEGCLPREMTGSRKSSHGEHGEN